MATTGGGRDADSALRHSQRLLDAISDNSEAVIYAKDTSGRYLFVNRRFGELFHVTAESMLGKSDYDLFDADRAETFRDMDRRVAVAGAAITEEEVVPLSDGLHTYLSVKTPLRDDAGQIYAVFGISTDITDRKRAEESAHVIEQRTRQIVETALDAVVTIDQHGVIIEWSPQAERTFGWRRDEILGRSLADAIVPERYREAHRRGLARYVATGQAVVLNRRLELSALHRDGREFPIELAITPLETGSTVSFSAFVRDITERKRMEQALIESQQHYRALAESLPNLVWTCRPDGYCDFLSRQWVEYTGRPAEEQFGYGWAEHVHPDDRDHVRAEWATATERGDAYQSEFRLRRADGVYRWFHTRAVPHKDSDGRVTKWFGSNTDFEDFKQAERRLHAQVERLNLLDQLTRAIGERQDLQNLLRVVAGRLEEQLPVDFACACLYDATDNVLVVAQVGPRSAPLAAELGLVERARIPIDENGLSRCVHGRLVHESDLSEIPFPFPQRLARGGLRSLVAAPLTVESQVFGVLVVGRQATPGFSSGECEFLRQLSEHVALAAQQAQLYSALQRAYDDLRQTQQLVAQQERLKALGQMASGIAHDINNAITPLALCAELLLDTEPGLSDDARGTLAMMQHAIDDVAHTVAGLREFYRDRGAQPALGAVNLNTLVTEVVNVTRARWSDMPQQRGLSIVVATDLAADAAPLHGVESELRQALINLVFNAVDALPEGGHITVRTRRLAGGTAEAPAPRIVVEIADDGVGMSLETRQRCLEPFFTTKGERGSGLGLAMVYGVVQRHNGDIELESAPGQGTTVRLLLPVRGLAAGGAGSTVEPLRVTPLRLLVIDDDPMLLRALRTVLEVDKHVVTTADGGQAGIDAFREAHQDGAAFDAVITDLGMPSVDGRKVASAIKAQSPATPLIMLTGWGQRMLEDRDVPSYVDRVLAKPPRLADLRETLTQLTARP
jgi:PAS domain S-box-containing protein